MFSTTQWLLRYTGSSSFAQVFDYDLYRRTRACFLCMFVPPPRVPFHQVNLGSFFGPCHCSYIFIPCLAFRVHVAGDLNKTISFIVGVPTTLFARARAFEKNFTWGYEDRYRGSLASGFLVGTCIACFCSNQNVDKTVTIPRL